MLSIPPYTRIIVRARSPVALAASSIGWLRKEQAKGSVGMRLAIVASHPIQYHAPLFRELAKQVDLTLIFAHRATPADQAKAGFGVDFDWDIDLLSGYEHF